jgi:hypothetical protein
MESGGRVAVKSPYDPSFIRGVKALGGRWDPTSRTWGVASAREDRLRDLLRSVYGTDGSEEPLVAVRFEVIGRQEDGNEIRLAGRPILRRRSRDSQVEIYPYYDMAIIEGTIPRTGGSRKYPAVDLEEAVTIEALDVPRGVAGKLIEDAYSGEIVG